MRLNTIGTIAIPDAAISITPPSMRSYGVGAPDATVVQGAVCAFSALRDEALLFATRWLSRTARAKLPTAAAPLAPTGF